MLDLVLLFNALTQAFARIRPPLAQSLGQPVLTAALLTGLYAGYHVMRESSLPAGLRAAFLENNETHAIRLREQHGATLQAELRRIADTNRVIDELLRSLLDHAPMAARAQLNIIHNGATGANGMGLPRYDIANAVARPGHAAGPMTQNRPLTEWGDFLPDLLAGQCRTHATSELHDAAFRERLETANAGTSLVCPVTDLRNQLLGAVFLFWDAGIRPPDRPDLEHLIEIEKQLGIQIGAVLDPRAPSGID
jgi:hypothetical protein